MAARLSPCGGGPSWSRCCGSCSGGGVARVAVAELIKLLTDGDAIYRGLPRWLAGG